MTPETQDYEVQHDATRHPRTTNTIQRGRAVPEKRYRIDVDVRFNGTTIPNSHPRAKGPGVSRHLILRRDWDLVQKLIYGRDRSPKYPEFDQINPQATFAANEEEDRRIEQAKHTAWLRTSAGLETACKKARIPFDSYDWKQDPEDMDREHRKLLFEHRVHWQAQFQEMFARSPLPVRWAKIVADEDMEDDDERRRQKVLQESSQAQMEAFGDKLAEVLGGKSDEVSALRDMVQKQGEVIARLEAKLSGKRKSSKGSDES